MNPSNFPKRKTQKRVDAEARQDVHDALTPPEKLARLDAKFGKGQGATRERAKLEKTT